MKQYLIKFALALLRWCAYETPLTVVEKLVFVEVPAPPLVPDWLVSRARELTDGEALNSPGTSDEYKRHNVYARLIKDYPEMLHRDIGLAIELGLRKK